MVKLYNDTTGVYLGNITTEQLQYLIDQMEEESTRDRDYAITPLEIAYFEGHGADPELVALLRDALGDKNEVVIRWEAERPV